MKIKILKLTIAFICFCICGLCQQLTTDARAEQANGPKEPLFSEMPKYLKEDLLLYYSFDKPFSTKLTDLSGNNTHGDVHGVEYRPEGKYGGAGFFNGTDKFISVENVHLEAFTFSAWIKTSTGGINNRRVFLFDSGEESFFAIQGATRGDVEFNTVTRQEDENEWDDDGVESDNVKLKENTWTHIAVSFDGNRMGIYFNGRLIQMKELHGEGFSGILYIGGIEAHRGRFWHGMIDEVAVFKRALFAAEIQHIYDPSRDNPVLELKAYCENTEEWSPKLMDILQRVATKMQNENTVEPNLQSGRGIAQFYEIRKESTEQGKWEKEEEERIIQFQFKGNSSRSEIYSGPKDKIKQLDWIFVENPEYGIRSDGDDIDIEDNRIGIFHREIGYDMHPDTFNRFYGDKPAEFLNKLTKWQERVELRQSVTISDDGILQLAYIHTAPNERSTLEVKVNIGPPALVLSLVETEEEDDDKRRTKSSRKYNVYWQWYGDQCYIKNVEHIRENTEFDNDNNPEQPRHRYEHQKLEVLAYEALASIPDRMFTLSGLPLHPDTEVRDRLKKAEYTLDDVLRGRIKPGPQYKSLVGARLPDLNMLINDDFNTLIREEMALICFFDTQQRPSRSCVIELAKRAGELKEKGLTVLAVQASKIDKDRLSEWVRENTISIPVGMIEGDEKKTRSAWGVRSLPWLILTDKRHVVQAEGFGINEINKRIATMRKK